MCLALLSEPYILNRNRWSFCNKTPTVTLLSTIYSTEFHEAKYSLLSFNYLVCILLFIIFGILLLRWNKSNCIFTFIYLNKYTLFLTWTLLTYYPSLPFITDNFTEYCNEIKLNFNNLKLANWSRWLYLRTYISTSLSKTCGDQIDW